MPKMTKTLEFWKGERIAIPTSKIYKCQRCEYKTKCGEIYLLNHYAQPFIPRRETLIDFCLLNFDSI
ncbi:MAG: hypothetical protein CEE42_04240 [Promethearchaeota archaeon Loki_b31]|nr:MAG: hypothetical protein CEE42_04240 [Candidatus Lokiarchaeota archaeon Loki_b31]